MILYQPCRLNRTFGLIVRYIGSIVAYLGCHLGNKKDIPWRWWLWRSIRKIFFPDNATSPFPNLAWFVPTSKFEQLMAWTGRKCASQIGGRWMAGRWDRKSNWMCPRAISGIWLTDYRFCFPVASPLLVSISFVSVQLSDRPDHYLCAIRNGRCCNDRQSLSCLDEVLEQVTMGSAC